MAGARHLFRDQFRHALDIHLSAFAAGAFGDGVRHGFDMAIG